MFCRGLLGGGRRGKTPRGIRVTPRPKDIGGPGKSLIGYYADVRYACGRLGQGLLVLIAVPARVQELIARNLPIIPLVSPHVLVGATKGLGNLRPTVFDHHALWNVDELFWRGGPPGARR